MSCNHPCHVARSSYLAGMQGCKDRPRGKRRDFPLLSCLSPGLPSAASDISSFQYFYTLYTLPHHSLSIVALISTAFSLFSHIGHFTGSLTHHFIITGHYKRCRCFFNIQYISASKCWLKEVQSLTEDLCVCVCVRLYIFISANAPAWVIGFRETRAWGRNTGIDTLEEFHTDVLPLLI